MSFAIPTDQRLQPAPQGDLPHPPLAQPPLLAQPPMPVPQALPRTAEHGAGPQVGSHSYDDQPSWCGPLPSAAPKQATGEAATSAAEPSQRALRLPRFSLRTVFLAIALCCGMLALATAVNTAWLVLLVWVSLMVTGHVTGNLSGSSTLRGDRVMDEGPAYISPSVVAAPCTRLGEKAEFGRNMVVFTASSAAMGCVLALIYLVFGLKQRPPVLGLLIGGLSAAVIAGLLGFMAGSFVNVFRHAFRQASGKLPPSPPDLEGETRTAENPAT